MNTAKHSASKRLLHLAEHHSELLGQLGLESASDQLGCRLTFHCKLVTPALLGGADPRAPDSDQPIRVKDVRGKLRMWWRILARAGDLNAELAPWLGQQGLSPTELESVVWGSIHGSEPNRGVLRIEVQEVPTMAAKIRSYETLNPSTKRAKVRDEFERLSYALDQAGKAPQGSKASGRDEIEAACRPIILSGAGFRLTVSFDDKTMALQPAVLKVVWAWMHFGGVGGRNARGLGAVQISKEAAGELLPPPPQFDGQRTNNELKCLRGLSLGSYSTAEEAVAKGLDRLKEFCQGLDVGRRKKRRDSYQPDRDAVGAKFKASKEQGRSLWPEADTIRSVKQTFFVNPIDPEHRHDYEADGAVLIDAAPRLAFGHRTIKFVDTQVTGYFDRNADRRLVPTTPDPQPQTLVPADADRLPSSLLIRPRLLESGRWTCTLLQLQHMAEQLRTMTVPIADPHGIVRNVPVWPQEWRPGVRDGCDGVRPLEMEAVRSPVGFPPPKDAAQAFMNYALNTWTK